MQRPQKLCSPKISGARLRLRLRWSKKQKGVPRRLGICIASARCVYHALTEKLQRPGNEGPEGRAEEVYSEEAHYRLKGSPAAFVYAPDEKAAIREFEIAAEQQDRLLIRRAWKCAIRVPPIVRYSEIKIRLKFAPKAPAVKREAEEDWGREWLSPQKKTPSQWE
jgi:hypothetical protein